MDKPQKAKPRSPIRAGTHSGNHSGTPSPATPATVIGLDIGYGYVKILQAHQEPIVFPSLVAPKEPGLDLGLADGHAVVSVDHTEFLVGEAALNTPTRFHEHIDAWWTLPSFKALLAFCRRWIPKHVHLVTGLPLHVFTNRASHDQITRIIDAWLHPKDLTLLPQGYGAFCHLLAECPEMESQRIALVDIGMRTTELIGIIRTQCSSRRSRGLVLGIQQLFEPLAGWTRTNAGRPMDPYEIDGVLRGTNITIRGETVRREVFEKAYATVKHEWLDRLSMEIEVLWGNHVQDFDQLIFSGGGSSLLEKDLLERFPYAKIAQAANLANAKGYLAFGLWKNPQLRPTDHVTPGGPSPQDPSTREPDTSTMQS